MNRRKQRTAIGLVAAFTVFGGLALFNTQGNAQGSSPRLVRQQDAAFSKSTISETNVKEMLNNWAKEPKDAAMMMMKKYGTPNEATPTMIIWHKNGPWKRTIIYREEIGHDFPRHHTDFVEQFIDYRVPSKKFSDLAKYDGSVVAQRTKGEISARCDKEEMNFLALNLAHDIVVGRRSVNDARKFYAMTAMAFMKGEKPSYTQSLQFDLMKSGTKDPDEPAMMKNARR